MFRTDKRLTLLEERFMKHMEIEEATMRELKNDSKDSGVKIDKLCETVNELSARIQSDVLTTDIKINTAKDELKSHVRENYATRRELNDGLKTIRESARLIWITLAASGATLAWAIDKFLR